MQSGSLPRLELRGILLSQLMSNIKATLTTDIVRKYYWSDSTIMLAWINDLVDDVDLVDQ